MKNLKELNSTKINPVIDPYSDLIEYYENEIKKDEKKIESLVKEAIRLKMPAPKFVPRFYR